MNLPPNHGSRATGLCRTEDGADHIGINIRSRNGSSTTPVLVFLGIVTLSVVFFFVFTLPRRGQKSSRTQQPASATAAKTPAATTRPGSPEAGTTAPAAPAQPLPPAAAPKAFFVKASPLLTAFSEKLAAGKPQETADLLSAPLQPAKAEALRHLFTTAAFRPAVSGAAVAEVGRIGTTERWSLPVEKGPSIELTPLDAPVPASAPEGTTAPNQPIALELDLKATREQGYQISDVRFPPRLVAAAAPVLQSKGIALDAVALTDPPDPLSLSADFLTNLLAHQFHAARSMTDEGKLTHEKLAGLCIVFEEGEYRMAAQGPLNVTAANDDRAWAIVRVSSRKTPDAKGEFGIEMARDPVAGWKVNALDFSKLMQTYVQSTDAGKVYYTPVVKSPSGGESLVVYFEYDRAELTDRALRQLEIVAGLLRSDAARKLRITGHADALGPEDYNFQLSKKRADNVTAKLKELGVDPRQLVAQGFGESTPLDPNLKDDGSDNPEGRSRNRRTEIFLDF